MLWNSCKKQTTAASRIRRAIGSNIESLESRQLMSGSPAGFFGGGHPGHGGDHGSNGGGMGPGGGGPDGFGPGGGGPGGGGATIAFSLTPTSVQTGLDKLATAGGLTDPTADSLVHLGNFNGIETYSVTISSSGTVSILTVDQAGDAVTAPVRSTTTWAILSGTGSESDAAAAAEITTIATAKGLTAPVSTDTVDVTTTSAGAVTYSIHLTPSATATGDENFHGHDGGPGITVDAAGNPVGDQVLPFSVFSTTIQDALNANKPATATSLTATSTQDVRVRMSDGITTYSTAFTVSGTRAVVTVDAAGKLTSLPTTTTTTFSALSSAVQTALQALATADGVTSAIASDQVIKVLTETSGTVLYSATLSAAASDNSVSGRTFDVTVTVDSDANPTVLPRDDHGMGHGGFPGRDHGPGPSGGTNANSSSGSNSSTGSTVNASNGVISLPGSVSSPATSSGFPASTAPVGSYLLNARLLSGATNGLGMLGGYFVEFAPATVSATVQADLTQIATDQKQLLTDVKALSATDKATLKADIKAIASAVKATTAAVSVLQKTLKTDSAAWASTLRSDFKAIRIAKGDTTALTAAKAQLATDRASAFAAITVDQAAIQTAIDSDAGVTAAKAKLAADLPTIAADQATIKSDQAILMADLKTASVVA